MPDPIRHHPRPTTHRPIGLLPAARAVLATHRPDPGGLCAGCRHQWNRVVPHPCTQSSWAQAVHDRIPTPETLTTLGFTDPTRT